MSRRGKRLVRAVCSTSEETGYASYVATKALSLNGLCYHNNASLCVCTLEVNNRKTSVWVDVAHR